MMGAVRRRESHGALAEARDHVWQRRMDEAFRVMCDATDEAIEALHAGAPDAEADSDVLLNLMEMAKLLAVREGKVLDLAKICNGSHHIAPDTGAALDECLATITAQYDAARREFVVAVNSALGDDPAGRVDPGDDLGLSPLAQG